MKTNKFNIKTSYVFLFGLLAVLLSNIPFFILGMDSIIPYHDQLDGEIIAYIYRAKYLFSGDLIPEFLNGASKNTLTPPAPLAVLLFRIFRPFTAYMILQIMGQLVAYVGMFILAKKTSDNHWIAVIVALLYTFLPFLPAYGLSQYGMPLLLVCLWALYKNQHTGPALVYVGLYTALSSLVLCGFVWLGIWGLTLLVLLCKKQLKDHLMMLWGFLVMTGIYLFENISLILQIFGLGTGYVSHKSEYVLSGNPFWDTFRTYLLYNAEHSEDQHIWILGLVLLVAVTVCGAKCSDETKQKVKWLALDLGVICLLCLVAAVWESNLCVGLRSNLGAIGSFQLGRVLWLTPTLWYLALALCLSILWNPHHSTLPLLRYLGYAATVAIIGVTGLFCLLNSFVKPNVQEILIKDYDTISWSDYYALGVMEQAEQVLLEQEGLTKSQYRVASLGIDPVAALYHGFYCLDGYSNNYDLKYKHAFREVIAPELERNDWIRTYYDGWGNRCYLYSSEIPGYFNIQKGSFWYNDLQLNTDALSRLGCDYILSAAYIVNAEDLQLELLTPDPCTTPDSYYNIYIYKLR